MHHLSVVTLSSYTTQRKIFEGRPHIVAPVVLLTEGVHHGSAGPMYYPDEELRAFPGAWNGVPIPVLHPNDEDGLPISCNSPEVIEQQNVGRLFNVTYQDGKLRGELWVDEGKAQFIAPQLLADLRACKPIEVSTGLFSDDEAVEGEWNGEHYDSIVRHIRPDHLALLPGQVGACSIADGCGVRANKGKGGVMGEVKVNFTFEGVLAQITKDEKLKHLVSLAVNKVMQSYEEMKRGLQKEVDSWDQHRNSEDGPYALHYVVATYSDHFVYIKETKDGSVLYKRNYSVSGEGKISIGEEVVEVREESRYVEVANNSNPKEATMADKTKCCPKKVQALIDNQFSPYEEADKVWLEELTENQLEKLELQADQAEGLANGEMMKKSDCEEMMSGGHPSGGGMMKKEDCKKMKGNVEDVKPKTEEKPPVAVVAVVEEPKTMEEAIKQLPEAFRTEAQAGLKLHKEKKEYLVNSLMENQLNSFTKEELEGKSVDELDKLAKLSRVQDYSAKGGPDVTKTNASEGVEVLELPKSNLSKKEDKK